MRVKVGVIGEMESELLEIKRQGGYVVGILEVPGPLPWQIKMALDHKDVIRIAKLVLKPSILLFLLFGGLRDDKKAKLPPDF